MKRPNSRPAKPAALPKAPASKAAKAKKPPKAKGKPAVSKPLLKREEHRLAALRKSSKSVRKNQARELASEIRRFTAASRRRKIIAGISFGSVGLLFALLLATWFTPILAIEKIVISGNDRIKTKALSSAVSSLVGTPLTLVDENQLAERLKAFELIESFSTISNPPHTLEIRIVERQPIAQVNVGGTYYLYDPAGVQIGVAKPSDKVPVVEIQDDPAQSTQYRQAIEVILALPIELNNQIASVKASSKDNVQLSLTGGISRTVIWGDHSDSVLKSKVLAALFNTTKKNRAVVFDVSSPNTPTVRYLNF